MIARDLTGLDITGSSRDKTIRLLTTPTVDGIVRDTPLGASRDLERLGASMDLWSCP